MKFSGTIKTEVGKGTIYLLTEYLQKMGKKVQLIECEHLKLAELDNILSTVEKGTILILEEPGRCIGFDAVEAFGTVESSGIIEIKY